MSRYRPQESFLFGRHALLQLFLPHLKVTGGGANRDHRIEASLAVDRDLNIKQRKRRLNWHEATIELVLLIIDHKIELKFLLTRVAFADLICARTPNPNHAIPNCYAEQHIVNIVIVDRSFRP